MRLRQVDIGQDEFDILPAHFLDCHLRTILREIHSYSDSSPSFGEPCEASVDIDRVPLRSSSRYPWWW